MFEYNNYSEFNIILPILFPFDIQGYNKITHKMHETHSINFWKKNAKTHQKCLSTYVYRKKNWVKFVKVMTSLIFLSNGKLRFRLDYLIELIFLDYKNLV
jgi:hypothetical protein